MQLLAVADGAVGRVGTDFWCSGCDQIRVTMAVAAIHLDLPIGYVDEGDDNRLFLD
jgi:hypothetical protein